MNKLAISRIAHLLLVTTMAACPVREVPDASADGGSQQHGDVPDRMSAPKLPPPDHKGLGVSCSARAECSSDFCVDGVCCDAACDATCFACSLPGTIGSCSSINNSEDAAGTPSCAGTRICGIDTSGATACLLKDGEACTLPADCATRYCRTYFRDEDSDGYGVESADTITRCDATSRPPQGYAAAGGDCCDLDPGASPGVTAYFTTGDSCGSYDWNCSDVEEKQSTESCPTTNGGPLPCGQACTIVFKGTGSVVFVQACH